MSEERRDLHRDCRFGCSMNRAVGFARQRGTREKVMMEESTLQATVRGYRTYSSCTVPLSGEGWIWGLSTETLGAYTATSHPIAQTGLQVRLNGRLLPNHRQTKGPQAVVWNAAREKPSPSEAGHATVNSVARQRRVRLARISM
jgi:hypothetical protein